MSRSVGLFPRRAHLIDAETVIVGPVLAGTRGRAAATRDGSARLLTTLLNMQVDFRATIYGHTAAASGGYLLEVAHVPPGGVITDAAGWHNIAILSVSGVEMDEAFLSGAAIHKAVKEKATAATAITASALSTNVVTLTIGAHTFRVGDYVTVSGMTGAGVPMNGTYPVSAIAATTISYALTNADIADGGTAGSVYAGTSITTSTDEIRVGAVLAIAGDGSNGAGAPSAAGTITLALEPRQY